MNCDEFNRYRHAMKIRGELMDLSFNNEVISTMDLKYGTVGDKTMHYDDHWKLFDECTKIILEAFTKAKLYDEYINKEEKIDEL